MESGFLEQCIAMPVTQVQSSAGMASILYYPYECHENSLNGYVNFMETAFVSFPVLT
jgi:hypothetical protein